MTVGLSERLKSLGVELVNSEADNSVVIDRRLITGASPLASNVLGVLAATTLLENIK
jgi:molecular chaperone Hsp31 and glyoxalase 3